MFLNEETSQTETINDFVVTEEFTGEDTELLTIMVEHEQYMHNLSIAMMRAEHRSIVEEDTALYEQAKEGFFKRAGDHIKKFWARVVAFFKALWSKVAGLFVNRQKWVKANRDAIKKGAPKTSMNLPSKFKEWGTSDYRLVVFNDKIEKLITDAPANMSGVTPNEASKNINKELTGKFEEVVNYSAFFNEQIGEMVDTQLGTVVNEIINELIAFKNVKNNISYMSKQEKLFLGKVKDLEKGNFDQRALSNLNKLSTMVVSFTKALHNTSIRMNNYAWQACRKAASAANLKEGTDVTETEGEEGKDLTNTNESSEDTNKSEGKKDILSQYMDE